MVRGLGAFLKYFKEFNENYIIIGGTACDLIIDDPGLTPRATKDIDIILVVEALSADFVKQFWQFIEDGQ
jgi:predicted nucleotidyltransferase